MWELTGGHLMTLLLPVLLAAAGASVTARALGGGSIYSVRLPLDGHRERWSAPGTWAVQLPARRTPPVESVDGARVDGARARATEGRGRESP